MDRRIKFNDGTYLSIIGQGNNTVGDYGPETIYTYSNAIITIKNGSNYITFTNEKTDLDGNIWRAETVNGRQIIRIYWGGGTSYSTIENDNNYSQSFSFFYYDGQYPDYIRWTRPGISSSTSPAVYYDGVSGTSDFITDVGQIPNKAKLNGLSNFGLLYYSGNRDNIGIPISFGGTLITLSNFAQSYEEIPDETDPYNPGGESGTGGGHGTFSGTGDSIGIPSLPTLSAVDTGFITLFNPSIAQLQALANYMWTNPLFDPANWRKIFADPMDAILGLSIVPVNVPSGGTGNVTVGNISTGVAMTKATAQYVEVDCGTLDVAEYWGAYLDYAPFTKAEIYLPYCGTHPVSTDDVMNKSVHVVYHIDILSGACCAFVKCGDSVLYSFVGQCSCSIPITGNDWTNVINGALNIATSIGSMVATGGATAPLAVGSIASTSYNTIKPSVEKSGAMGGMGGMLGIQVPYLILTRPKQALPRSQNKYIGYPSFITKKLSDLQGYTEVESIRIANINATNDELNEINSLLRNGVVL